MTAVPGIGFRSQAPPTPVAAVPRHPSERTRRRSTLRGCRLALGLGEAAAASTTSQPGGGSGVGSIHSPKRADRTRTPNDHRPSRGTRETECDKVVGVSHSTADVSVCLVRYHTEERERDRNTPSRTTRNAVLPCSVLPCAKCAGSLPPYYRNTRTRTATNVKAAPILLGAVCGRRRSVGNAPWRSRGPAQLAGCLEERAWTLRVAVAVVDQVVFWRLASASGCRAGPVASVRKRRRRVPFSGKICKASGVASWGALGALGGRSCCVSLAWLVLPFFLSVFLSLVLSDRNTRGTWPSPGAARW